METEAPSQAASAPESPWAKAIKEAELQRQIRERADEVWVTAEPVVREWQGRLSAYESKHSNTIRGLIAGFANLFQEPVPSVVHVDLHYHPRENATKGEPASGLAGAGFIPEADSDVFYWVGKFTRLPNDGPQQLEDEVRMVTAKVVHEDIHHDLQRDNFQRVVSEASHNNDISTLRERLMAGQADYLSPEAEMTAIYLEQYSIHILKSASEGNLASNEPFLDYRFDRERFDQLVVAATKADYSWKQDGPYTSLRRGWGLPDIPRASSARPHTETPGPNIYQIGAGISDFSLYESYRDQGRPIDVDFIRHLYNLFLAEKDKIIQAQKASVIAQ